MNAQNLPCHRCLHFSAALLLSLVNLAHAQSTKYAAGDGEWDSNVWAITAGGAAASGVRPANGDTVQWGTAVANIDLAVSSVIAAKPGIIQMNRNNATLTLNAGGLLSTTKSLGGNGNLNVAQLTGGNASVRINGGALGVSGNLGLAAGANSRGVLTVNDGDLIVADTLFNVNASTGNGTIHLAGGRVTAGYLASGSGTRSFVWTAGALTAGGSNLPTIANTGKGILDIGGSGLVDADGFQHTGVQYQQGSQAMLRLDVASATSYDYYDAPSSGSAAQLDGVVAIYLLGNYVPPAGTTFDVVRATTVTNNGIYLSGPARDLFNVSVANIAGGRKALRLTAKSGIVLKAPFKTMFSNDTTNIVNLLSPYAPTRPSSISTALLQSSVREVEGRGIDVHLLQPGLGWTPWWQSAVLPMRDHLDWAAWLAGQLGLSRLPRTPTSYENFIAANPANDLVQTFVAERGPNDPRAFISYRLNDLHHVYAAQGQSSPPTETNLANCQFYYEHPEWRVGDNAEDLDGNGGNDDQNVQYLMDWSHPEVVQYKLRFIQEIIRNYNIDGIELDFMRYWVFFNQNVSMVKRQAIMTRFVQEVRTTLDQKQAGRRLWLCVRVPGYVSDPTSGSIHSKLGIDPDAFANAGVDMVNISHSFYTDPQLEIDQIRAQLPDRVALYVENHFTNAFRQPPGEERLTTELQHYTVAYLAYLRGADGMSTFNLHYSRNHASNPANSYDPAKEPPFGMFANLENFDFLAQLPQHYVVGSVKSGPKKAGRPLNGIPQVGVPMPVTLHTAKRVLTPGNPPVRGWNGNGILRIQGASSLAGAVFQVKLNGTVLNATSNVAEPYTSLGYKNYTQGRGNPVDYKAWVLPKNLLYDFPVDGLQNTIEISLISGTSPQLCCVDIAIQ